MHWNRYMDITALLDQDVVTTINMIHLPTSSDESGNVLLTARPGKLRHTPCR